LLYFCQFYFVVYSEFNKKNHQMNYTRETQQKDIVSSTFLLMNTSGLRRISIWAKCSYVCLFVHTDPEVVIGSVEVSEFCSSWKCVNNSPNIRKMKTTEPQIKGRDTGIKLCNPFQRGPFPSPNGPICSIWSNATAKKHLFEKLGPSKMEYHVFDQDFLWSIIFGESLLPCSLLTLPGLCTMWLFPSHYSTYMLLYCGLHQRLGCLPAL